jgi:hypothetical protein
MKSVFSIKEDKATVVCESENGNRKTKITYIPANVYKDVFLEDGCTGFINDNVFYPDSNYDSDENYSSFDLGFEKNYLEKIPGITETKLTHIFTLLDKVKTDVDITQIHQMSVQIDKNLELWWNNSFTNPLLYGTIVALAITFLAGGISIHFLFTKVNGFDKKIEDYRRDIQ